MAFDAYQKWLGIPPDEQPPGCYRLLGIREFEDDPDVIEAAADRIMAFLRERGIGPRVADSQRLLNEVANARIKLLKPRLKTPDDSVLQETTRGSTSAPQTKIRIVQDLASTKPRGGRRPAKTPATSLLDSIPSPLKSPLGIVGAATVAVVLAGLAISFVRGGGADDQGTVANADLNAIDSLTTTAGVGLEIVTPNDGSNNPIAPVYQFDLTGESQPDDPNSESNGVTTELTGHTEDVIPQNPVDDDPPEPTNSTAASENTNPHDGPRTTPPVAENPEETDPDTKDPSAEPLPTDSQGTEVATSIPLDERQPVPDAAALSERHAKIVEIFRDEFSQARTPQAKSELAKALMARATENDDISIDRYVFLTVAMDLAAESGDGKTALATIELLEKGYRVDALALKTEVAIKSRKTARSPEQYRGLAQFVAKLIEEAVVQDRFDLSGRLRPVALASASKARDASLAKTIRTRMTEIKKLELAFRDAAEAINTLRTDPADPQANLIAGRYYCFIKDDFEKGLPLLAACSDEQLSLIAKTEQTASASAAGQVELADNWQAIAASSRDKNTKLRSSGRAAYWYQKAIPRLTGLDKAAVEKKLKALGAKGSSQGKVGDGNVALASAGAKVHGKFRAQFGSIGENIIDGNASSAEAAKGSKGFAESAVPTNWIVELAGLYSLRQIRMKFPDPDKRFYRYVIETSVDGTSFTKLVDRSQGEWRSWQIVDFPPQAARYIRIRGLHNSAHEFFQLIEFEAYCKPNSNPPPK